MLTSSKSTISSTHDHLSNVMYKIQSCHQHHHYYHSDLIYRYNIKTKLNKRRKRRKRNRNKKINNKTIRKYLNSSKYSIKSYSNSINVRSSTNTINNINACRCVHYNNCCGVNLKISYQVKNFLKHVCVYFQKNFNNLQLVLVIILIALITCTVQSIDTQVKSQQKQITSPTLAAINDAATMATNNFNISLYTLTCQHHVPNAPRSAKAENNFKLKTYICHNLKYIYYQQLKAYTILRNMQFQNKNFSKWLVNNVRMNLKTNLYNQQNPLQINYQLHNNDEDHHHNDSAFVISKPQQSYKSLYKTEKKMVKDEQQQQQSTINNLNINKFFQNISTNKYSKNNSTNNFNNDLRTNHIINRKAKNVKDNISDNIDKYKNDFNDRGYHLVDDYDYQTLSENVSGNIDHVKLMKFIMDGLGLTKLPKMESVNISQEEYSTKYREYLQRVLIRKRQNIQHQTVEYNDFVLRPLEIYSIVSNNTLLNLHQEYQKSFNKIPLRRAKRNAFDRNWNDDDAKDKKQSLESRVKNILFLKKKYQKPRSTKKDRDERKTNIRLMFALKPEILNLSSSDIEEANIRLVLIHSPILAIRNTKNKKTYSKSKNSSCGSNKTESQKNVHQVNVLNLKLFFISKHGKRILLDGRKVNIHVDLTKPDETHTQWLQFDVTKAVKTYIDDKRLQHVVLELQCDNCKHIGARILNDAYNTPADALAHSSITEGNHLMPVLNIIGHFDQSQHSMRPHKYENHHSETNQESTTQRHYHHQTYNNNKNRHNSRTNCYKANQRCCRHSMEIVFKEIKGFEFIIQPKVFDAGYCHGRCPPRYNPAHHHALLQSLIWKQNHHKAPRPCCAPSKLVELEVLHVDEKDSEKLKISTWSDMKVVECACS